VDWEALVSPTGVGLGLTVSRVLVTFSASVEASASGTAASAIAEATAPFGAITACMASFSLPGCTNSPTNSISGLVPPNTPFVLMVSAIGGASDDSNFQASADPVIAIADALIPGTDINFRDAFTLSISPDVTQSVTGPGSEVPEPATDLLCSAGCGLVLIIFARRHHNSSGERSNTEKKFRAC
jgi:hypothetical protein